MRLVDYVEQNSSIKTSIFDQRTLASKVELSAGGTGSGRHKTEAYLREQGFTQHKVRGTKDGNDFQGNSHWSKKIITNPHGQPTALNTVTHTVTVGKDGSWNHTVTGIHGGNSVEELGKVHIAANKVTSTSGKGLDKLKALLAGGPGSGRKKGSYSLPFSSGQTNAKYKSISKGLKNQGFSKTGMDTSSTSFGHKDGSTAKVQIDKDRNLKVDLNAPEAVHHNTRLMMKANKTSKKETDTKIQAPSDLGKQKGKSPGKDGKIIAGGPGSGKKDGYTIKCPTCGAKPGQECKPKPAFGMHLTRSSVSASEGDCTICHKPGMLNNGVCSKCAKMSKLDKLKKMRKG